MTFMFRILLCATFFIAPSTTLADVRLGNNVRIGGHDFSNQTFNSQKRGKIYLYDSKPPREGCTWKTDGKGGRVKICRLQKRK